MIALGLILLAPLTMWSAQSLMRIRAGLPLMLRITSSGLPRRMQRVGRVVTNGSFALVLVAYPLCIGKPVIGYYAAFFPMGRPAWGMLQGLAAVSVYLGLILLAWTLTDNVRFELRHPAAVLLRRVAAAPFSALLGAAMEELLFRGMLLNGLLGSFSTGAAVTIGTVMFAAGHYVRRVKRNWTFAGHLALGMMLCVAFAVTRSLWLPIGLHAGGILIIMGVRPFIRYVGPAWLVGASIFPYAGVPGIVGLSLLTFNIWHGHGAVR